MLPHINYFVVAFALSNSPDRVLFNNFFYFVHSTGNQLFLFRRHDHIAHSNRNTRPRRIIVSQFLQAIEKICRNAVAISTVDFRRNFADTFVIDQLIDKGHRFRDNFIKNDAPNCSYQKFAINANAHGFVQANAFKIIRHASFTGTAKGFEVLFLTVNDFCQIIQTQCYFLRFIDHNRRPIGGFEQIV